MTRAGETATVTVIFRAYSGGPVTDPTGVSLSILHAGQTVLGPLGVPPVVRDGVGLYRYDWEVPDDTPAGTYTLAWSGTLPGQTTPSVGYEQLDVEAVDATVGDLPDSCWPVDTSCVPDWDAYEVEPDPEAGEPGVPYYTPAQRALAAALAGETMRMLTGYRVGGCPVTVRPCRPGRVGVLSSTYGGTHAPWAPVLASGTWLNIGCGCTSGCSCDGVSTVRLGGSVGAVVEVLVDGMVLDPTAYRLDAGGLLVRTDGDTWPLTQDLTADDTQPGTWSVTYLPEVAVDAVGARAAGALASEYVKACAGGECSLPSGVTQVVRSGVTLTLTPDVFPGGRTGVPVVDAYVRRWNPHALTAPSTVWSPDTHRPRTTL